MMKQQHLFDPLQLQFHLCSSASSTTFMFVQISFFLILSINGKSLAWPFHWYLVFSTPIPLTTSFWMLAFQLWFHFRCCSRYSSYKEFPLARNRPFGSLAFNAELMSMKYSKSPFLTSTAFLGAPAPSTVNLQATSFPSKSSCPFSRCFSQWQQT